MKKTHSANIGGTVFQVEEDAYEQLQAYLQSIESHFRSYPDVADIVADIEGRIAEQLLQREFASQVVRMADVERVIASMGRTEQFTEAATPDDAATAPAASGEDRKLFRDPEYKVIAGVAAGLAAYLGLPRLLVRIAFLVLLFFFGTALVVYLLLWVLVPYAASTTDKLQMRGRPLTLTSIDQGVRDSIASIAPGTRSMAARSVTAVGSLIHLVVVTIARALKWVAGIFVVGFAAVGVLFLTVMLVVAMVNAGAAPLHPDVAEFMANFGKWQGPFKVGVYLTAAIPLVVIIATGLRLFWGFNRLNTRGLTTLLGVWVVSLLATSAMWASSYPQLRQYMDEYPSTAEARRELDRYGALLAPVSPLTADQSQALLTTLAAEYKRREVNDGYGYFQYSGRSTRLEIEEQRITAKVESNRRVIEAARSYLDAQQLATLQAAMAEHIARSQADMREWRERLERESRDGSRN